MRTQSIPQFAEQRILYPQETTELSDGTKYTPFTGGGMAGLKCDRPGSPTSYIYFNPSDHTDDDVPNVFVYQGASGHPIDDPPVHHYVIWDEPTARGDTLARRAVRRLTRRRSARRPTA
jgi:hypothetical protein